MSDFAFLGPQFREPNLRDCLDAMGIRGPLVSITAGWQEREGEIDELRAHVGMDVRDLGLYLRTEHVYAEDPPLAAAYRERQDALQEMQDHYRQRLAAVKGVAQELANLPGDSPPLRLARRAALGDVRRLDRQHVAAAIREHAAFTREWHPARRASLVPHVTDLRRQIEGAAAVLVAGGHVAVLLNRMRLFGLGTLLKGKPLIAWSAGAMAVSERVVLFHDRTAQGVSNAEVLDVGLGLVHDVVPLPHAVARLALDDASRVRLFARRFAPAQCLALDHGALARWHRGRLVEARALQRLARTGTVAPLDPHSGRRGRDAGTASARAGSRPAAFATSDVSATSSGAAASTATTSEITGANPAAHSAPNLRELLASGTPTRETIDAFLHERECPLVDPHGVTFVYRGAVDGVVLRMFISGLPAAQPLQRVGDSDLWVLRLDLPPGSRFEYKFEVFRGGHGEWTMDPLNPHRAADPFGANSVCQGWGYTRPDWTLPDVVARAGSLDALAIDSRHVGQRQALIYVPARFRRSRRYPLLVCHDGEDYLRYADLKTVLDNLIHRLEIPPLVVALVNSPDRLREYVGFDPHADFVVHELLPAVAMRFPLDDDPSSRGLMGASLGGVASLHAAWRHPGTFGRLLLQSGSFAFTDIGENRRGPVFEPVVRFMNAFRAAPGRPADRLYVSCGIYESLIYENRSLLPLLQDQRLQVRYDEARDGHNWQNWRDRLQAGLNYLFPGPQWMVYE